MYMTALDAAAIMQAFKTVTVQVKEDQHEQPHHSQHILHTNRLMKNFNQHIRLYLTESSAQ